VTVDPSGRFAYVTNFGSNNVSAYTISRTTGALTAIGSPVAAGTNPLSVTVDPSGRFAYVANFGFGSNTVSAYTINATTGALTPVDANPGTPGIDNFPAGTQPISVTVDPSGRFAYVTNQISNNVSAYTISATTGALTALPDSPFPHGTSPYWVTVDPSGRFAYVANRISPTVSAYTIHATTGALTAIGSPVAAGTDPRSVTTSGTIQ
jgi:6-phosphogluconolactonase (cycloisomerase 2 family)